MSASRPARSLLGKCLSSTRTVPVIPCSRFHTSVNRSRFKNVLARDLGLLDPERVEDYKKMASDRGLLTPEQVEDYKKKVSPDYSAEDMAVLKKRYTPEQVEALEAAEEALDPIDFVTQGRLRDDNYRPTYIEDYTVLDPRIDVKPEIGGTPREPQFLARGEWLDNYGMNMIKTLEKKERSMFARSMVRALKKVKESEGAEYIDLTFEELKDLENNPDQLEKYLVKEKDKKYGERPSGEKTEKTAWTKEEVERLDTAVNEAWEKELSALTKFGGMAEAKPTNIELMMEGPAGVDRLHSAEAPELGKVPGVDGMYKKTKDPEDEGQDDEGKYQELKRLTGLRLKELRSILSKPLVTRRVANQTRLGKVRSTSVVAIAGNGNGRLGIGMAKSTEPGVAEETAQMLAIRNMKPVRRYENRTIYGNVSAKVSGTVVEIYSRPPGKSQRHMQPHKLNR